MAPETSVPDPPPPAPPVSAVWGTCALGEQERAGRGESWTHTAAEKSQNPQQDPAQQAVGALGLHISLRRASLRNHGSELGDMRVIIISSRPIILQMKRVSSFPSAIWL